MYQEKIKPPGKAEPELIEQPPFLTAKEVLDDIERKLIEIGATEDSDPRW